MLDDAAFLIDLVHKYMCSSFLWILKFTSPLLLPKHTSIDHNARARDVITCLTGQENDRTPKIIWLPPPPRRRSIKYRTVKVRIVDQFLCQWRFEVSICLSEVLFEA